MHEEHRKSGGNGYHPTPIVERRSHPRFSFTAAVEALDSQHRTRMNARTTDIGKGGCYVDTFSPFPPKTPVKVRLTSEKTSFVAEARVISSKTGMGMGLEFTSIEPQQMFVLDKWIGELCGSTPCEFPGSHDFAEHRNGGRNGSSAKEPGYVLNELIVALMRKGTLTEEEGRTMLLRLLHRDFLP